MSDELDIEVEIETSPDVWLAVEDEDNGYSLESSSINERTVTPRTLSPDPVPWMEGSIALAAPRDNVTEPLAVWVEGVDHYDFDTKVKAVTDALEQLSYRVRRRVGNSMQYWQCIPATYKITTSQEYLFATMGLITAQIPRLPAVILAEV